MPVAQRKSKAAPPAGQVAATMALVNRINDGLPLADAERLAGAICPDDPGFKYRLVSKPTYARRRADKAPLSKTESERIVRLSRIWTMAVDVWGDAQGARRFLTAPHMMMDDQAPLDVALSGELGGRMVEDMLGALAYGSAA